MDTLFSLALAHHTALRRKTLSVIWFLRTTACICSAWVLWLMVRPWQDTQAFLQPVDSFWQRNMSLNTSSSTWLPARG